MFVVEGSSMVLKRFLVESGLVTSKMWEVLPFVPLAVNRYGYTISPRLMVKKANHGSLRSSVVEVELSEYVKVTLPDTVVSSRSDATKKEAEKYSASGTENV